MRKMLKMSLACAMLTGVGSVTASAADGVNILDDVKFNAQIRPRIQMTDKDTATTDAGYTFTNRTNLSINAGVLGVSGLRTTLELNSVNDFDSLDQKEVDLAGEANVAKMSQANLTYGVGTTTLIGGRTTVNLDNQRFIGSVGWKQNFQTLDIFGALSRGQALEYTAVYVTGISGIWSGTETNWDDTASVALNASYKVSDALKVTGYGYMLEDIHNTYGVALSGKAAGAKFRLEYATQTDASFNTGDTVEADASYMNVCLGYKMDGILLGANYEVLSGADAATAGTTAFSTPLGTNHKFNGWADKFLGTPTAGLVDTNIMVGYKADGFGVVKAIYHTFSADVGSDKYGSEIDLLYKTKITSFKNVTGMVKAAMFTEDDSTAMGNTTKVWLMADYKFSI